MLTKASAHPLIKLVAVTSVTALVVVAVYLYWAWHRPLNTTTEVYVVKPGTSLRGLAHELQQRGVIAEPYTLTWLGYVTGRSRRIKAGEYRFRAGITATELIDQVVAGRVVQYSVVLVEGWNFRQVMKRLEATPKLTVTVQGLTPAQVMERLGHGGVPPEGRFFPDTYYYSNGHTDIQILSSAFDKMEAALREEWDARASDLPLKDADQALVLASIIEKETSQPSERPLIAGVFINRLRKGMRLQSDPTVIYGLGDRYDGNIHLRDLREDTPYNTYTRAGLPPTPIAMPGLDSLKAALHPADTNALYFVARGDGSHVFSSTLEAHTAAVAKYQLGGKARGSTTEGDEGATGGRTQRN